MNFLGISRPYYRLGLWLWLLSLETFGQLLIKKVHLSLLTYFGKQSAKNHLNNNTQESDKRSYILNTRIFSEVYAYIDIYCHLFHLKNNREYQVQINPILHLLQCRLTYNFVQYFFTFVINRPIFANIVHKL